MTERELRIDASVRHLDRAMTGRELRIACGTSSSKRRYALWRPEFGPFVEGDLARGEFRWRTFFTVPTAPLPTWRIYFECRASGSLLDRSIDAWTFELDVDK